MEHFGFMPDKDIHYNSIEMDCCLCQCDIEKTFYENGINYKTDAGDYYVGMLDQVKGDQLYMNTDFFKYQPYKPQLIASEAVVNANRAINWSEENSELRNKIIMPCGSGKTFTAFLIIKQLKPNSVIITVPNLLLKEQVLKLYYPELHNEYKFICICTQADKVHEEIKGFKNRIDKRDISNWYKNNSNNKTITICTYQSIDTLCDVLATNAFKFDLGIIDEAHRTAIGFISSFSKILFNDYVPIRHRVFMTATERIYMGQTDELFDMNSESHYGKTAYTYSIKEGITDGVLNNYKVATIFSTKPEVYEFINNNPEIKSISEELTDKECTQIVSSIMCVLKAIREKKCKKIITYHSNVKKAKLFTRLITLADKNINAFHVNGIDQEFIERQEQIEFFKHSMKPAVLTNAQALVEGIDIPRADAVVFVDKKDSHISIIQAIGRCLRISEGKGISYVLIPILLQSDKDIKKENAEFLMLYRVLMAITLADQRLYSKFSERGESSSGYEICDYLVNDNFVFKNKLQQLINDVELRIVKRLNIFLPFENAREFVHNMKINSQSEYKKLGVEGKLPINIPRCPYYVYNSNGWTGWADYLGNGNKKRGTLDSYLSYTDCAKWARENMLPKGINSGKKWRNIIKTLPTNIPARPDMFYEEFIDWATFYGIETSKYDSSKVFGKKLGYEDAKKYVQEHLVARGITSLLKYQAHLHLIPDFLPRQPSNHYNKEFNSNDFFGNDNYGRSNGKEYRSYNEAKKWVQKNVVKPYKITDCKLWEQYVRGKIEGAPYLPKDIPHAPANAYKRRKKWKGWGDWFGTGVVASYNRKFWKYEKARDWVHKNIVAIGINSSNIWNYEYTKGKIANAPALPKQIPNYPPSVYKGKGWNGWGEFFGTGRRKHKPTKK